VTELDGSFRGRSWGRDGVIIFNTNAPFIPRVAAFGGAAAPATPKEQLLPDGSAGGRFGASV